MCILPFIDPVPFAVLYDDFKRPCYPVNVLPAAKIYKAMHHLSDQELIEMAEMYPATRFALHLPAYYEGEKTFCQTTLIEFRGRVQSYFGNIGRDLLHECGLKMAAKEAEIIHSSDKIRRIDSGFVDSHLGVSVDSSLEHYLTPNDWNAFSYHDQTTPLAQKQDQVLKDAAFLLEAFGDHPEVSIHLFCLLLRRFFHEQAITEDGVLSFKHGKFKEMDFQILLNPSDRDATFRKKAGEEHKGYVGLIVDQDQGPKTIRSYREYGVNITADPLFLDQYLTSLPDKESTDQPDVLVGDGLCSSEESKRLARKKNLAIVTTNLSGKKPNMTLMKFQLSEDEKAVEKCPAGHEMISSVLNEKTGQITAHLENGHCEKWPFCKECPHTR